MAAVVLVLLGALLLWLLRPTRPRCPRELLEWEAASLARLAVDAGVDAAVPEARRVVRELARRYDLPPEDVGWFTARIAHHHHLLVEEGRRLAG